MEILLYVLYLLLAVVGVALIVVVYLLVEQQVIYRTNPNKEIKRKFVYRFAKVILWASRVEVEVEGKENLPTEDGFLLVPNHQSNFDPFVLQMINRLMAYVGKIELENKPVVHEMFMITDGLYINRQDIRASIKTINEASKRLASGTNFVIFTEGTRSKGKEMLPFKAGSLKVATKAKATIVPVTQTGNYTISKTFPKKSKIKVIIGKPITHEDYQDLKETQLIKQIQDSIQRVLDHN
jgi:1-acyl-sn-glycerol-3-phosphate acyltransferase